MADSKAVLVDPALIRRLHSLHQQKSDLEGQIRRGPMQVAAAQKLVDDANAKLDAAREQIKSATMAADEKQLQLATREAKIKELGAKLNTAASNKEFTLLKEEIAATESANGVLSDEILEALEAIDGLEQDAADLQKELHAHVDAKEEREQAVNKRLEVVRADLEDVHEKISTEEKVLPPSAMSIYRRLVDAVGDEAMSGMDGDSCESCNQVMRTQIIDHIRMKHLVQCPGCHAILYQR